MAETLEAWLTRQLRSVSEDGKSTRAIRLCAGDGGETWERWDAPLRKEEGGPGPEKLAEIIEEVIRGSAEEWPAKSTVQIMIAAEDGEGIVRAKRLQSVRGKSQTSNGAALGGEALQHAEASRAHADTTKTLLAIAQTQNKGLAEHNQNLMEKLEILIEKLLNEKLEHMMESAANAEGGKPVLDEELTKAFLDKLGPLAEMLINTYGPKGPPS